MKLAHNSSQSESLSWIISPLAPDHFAAKTQIQLQDTTAGCNWVSCRSNSSVLHVCFESPGSKHLHANRCAYQRLKTIDGIWSDSCYGSINSNRTSLGFLFRPWALLSSLRVMRRRHREPSTPCSLWCIEEKCKTSWWRMMSKNCRKKIWCVHHKQTVANNIYKGNISTLSHPWYCNRNKFWGTGRQHQKRHVDARDVESAHGTQIGSTPGRIKRQHERKKMFSK